MIKLDEQERRAIDGMREALRELEYLTYLEAEALIFGLDLLSTLLKKKVAESAQPARQGEAEPEQRNSAGSQNYPPCEGD